MNRRPHAAVSVWIMAGLVPFGAGAQVPDSTLAQEGIYERPFIGGPSLASIGGYVEGNTNYFVDEGAGEGFSMELRRFNIFLFSQVSERVRVLSELEFEHGTDEIALETALVDLTVRPELVVRGGILLPPLGFFNQNHDGPKWDFVERPLVSTEIIPSTLSEVGVGVYGKIGLEGFILSYDAYVTNGLGDGVVGNEHGRTDLASGKRGGRFEDDNNGSPAISARIAARRPSLGEIGLSYYGGYYNSFRAEGIDVDERRWLEIAAFDFGLSVGPTDVRGEIALAAVDVPPAMAELFASRQWGGHVDVVLPLWHPRWAGYEDARLSAILRVERVDFNVGRFESTNGSIGDEIAALVTGISFRPTAETVFRANYRHQWTVDFVGNDATRVAGFQLGLATYF